MRRFLVVLLVLGAVAGVVAGVWFGMDARAKKRLRSEKARWRADVAKEVAAAEALRMPVLYGTPRDANAAEEEWALIRAADAAKDLDDSALEAAADQAPGAPLTPEARALLDAGRGRLQALERALTATGCDWGFDYERSLEAETPSLRGARRLGLLSVLAGHERAAAGDLAGAVRWYLHPVRLGADLGQGGILPAMIGTLLATEGLEVLGRLAAAPPSAAAVPVPLDGIAQALAALEPVLPAASAALRRERLIALGLGFGVAKAGSLRAITAFGPRPRSIVDLLRSLVRPTRRTVARALPELDTRFREAEAAVATARRSEQDRRLQAIARRAEKTRNPLVATIVVPFSRIVPRLQVPGVRLALCRLALTLERWRQEDGRYPQTLDEADRPVDHLARPVRLHYEPSADGKTYRIWSAGPNGRDDGGRSKRPADDLALEGRAP